MAGWNGGKRLFLIGAAAIVPLMIGACSKSEDAADDSTTTTNTTVATSTSAPGAPPVADHPAADSTDTMGGQKLADFKGDAASGKTVFAACMTCHVVDAGVNRVGPSLHGIVGRKAGSIPNFSYSDANKNSGIIWTEDKLFQYLEKPQRVVPGTKMTYAGVTDPQKRADVIAYLKSNS